MSVLVKNTSQSETEVSVSIRFAGLYFGTDSGNRSRTNLPEIVWLAAREAQVQAA